MSDEKPIDRKDAEAGMRWWNAMAREDRAYWLERARSAVPADAWAAYKAAVANRSSPNEPKP